MSNEVLDVLVVGGGPGGSTAAAFLGMQGHKVLLLEREVFPRHQIGESLLPATVHGICNLLGVGEELAQANFPVKRGGMFRWGASETPWHFDWAHHPMLNKASTDFAYQVERAKFDDILLKNAKRRGVVVREGARVTELILEDGRAVGVRYCDDNASSKEMRARYVVDASGYSSLLAAHVSKRRYSQFFQNLALYGYFENGRRFPPPRSGNILCAAFDKGWFWYLPLSDTLTSVGAVIGQEHRDLLRQDHAEALDRLIDVCRPVRDLLCDAKRVTEGMYGEVRVRKDYSYTSDRFWIPGLALIGDAACFIDPVFSSGVHLSTYAALLVARSINTCLRGEMDEDLAFGEFEARYRAEFDVFYRFLLTFYEFGRDEASYFWSARKVLNTPEAANEAFMRLVAGAGTTGEEFFRARGEQLRQDRAVVETEATMVNLPALKALREEGDRLVRLAFEGSLGEGSQRASGLSISPDGFRWVLGN